MKKYLFLIFFIFLLNSLSAQTINYSYDNLGRLTQAAYPDNSVIKYTYDASGNRSTIKTKLTPSANANLANLALSNGTLMPAFAAATQFYTASVSNAVSSITITPTTSDANASVTVNSIIVLSGTPSASLPLLVGPNYFTIKVTATNGTTVKTYSITVNRAKSSDATLAGLALSAGVLSPPFAVGITNYTAAVSYATTSIKITPTANATGATIKVNGVAVASGTASANILLNTGHNIITTVVTAQDGTTIDTYTIAVTRTSSVANLANIVISSGTLKPGFTTATISYADTVASTITSVKVTPTTSDAAATVTVNGTAVTSGTASAAIPLVTGNNSIIIKGIAFDGTVKTYVITVNRAKSSNSTLANLSISSGKLSPAFAQATQAYFDTVTYATTSVTVTPTTSDATATVTVNGTAVASGTASPGITLAVGYNLIKTLVTAQNGSVRSYFITIHRLNMNGLGSFYQYQPVAVVKSADNVSIENDGITVHPGVSPNGDGVNDFLTIDGITAYPDNKLSIIDRNGALVYEAKGYDNSSRTLDGHSNKNGAMQVPGTYFYSLDYAVKGQSKHKTGFIILKY